MIKIIFIFLMVFTIYENNKVLAANQMATVDQVVTFLDKYQSDIEKAVEKISSNKKIDNQKKIQYYFKRIFSRSSNIWLGVAHNALLFTERQMDFFSYLKGTFSDFDVSKTSKTMIDIYKNHYNFQKYGYFDEEKDTESSIKSFIDKNIDDFIPKKLKSLRSSILKSNSSLSSLDSKIQLLYKDKEKYICDIHGSPQDKFYNFYLSCLSIELLAMTSMINSYGFRELIKPSSKNKEKLKKIIDESHKRIDEYSYEFASSLARVPISYRNCDPYGKKKHQRDVSFIEMTGLYQYILMYSYKLGDDTCVSCDTVSISNGTSIDQCYVQTSESSQWNENGVPKDFDSCTTPRICNGRIHRCETIWTAEYCMLKNNARRYKWLRDVFYSDDEHTEGDISAGCNDGIYAKRQYQSGSIQCPFCWCLCDDTSYSSKVAVDRISLLPAMSLTVKNKVVTGAKMIIKDNILHIQVEDGVIGPNYLIERKTNNWVKLPEIKNDIQESLANEGEGKYKRDTDYVKWDWEKNAFNMDEILVEYGRVMTGLKFGIKKEEGLHPDRIQIQIHSTKYDWKNGKLLKDTGKWHVPDGNHTNPGLYGRLNPSMIKKKTVIDSKADEYYIFSYTEGKSDAAQTTIPLIDAFSIGAKTSAAMSGIALHHRSSHSKSGGFFGFTGHSVEYSKYMNELTG